VLSSEVCGLEADPIAMTSLREEIDVCMSSSDGAGEPYMRCRLEDNYIPRLSYKFLQEPPERVLLLLVAVSRADARCNFERAPLIPGQRATGDSAAMPVASANSCVMSVQSLWRYSVQSSW